MTGYEALQLVQAHVLEVIQIAHAAQEDYRQWVGSPLFKVAVERDGKEKTLDTARLGFYLAMGAEEHMTRLSLWLAQQLQNESPLWLPGGQPESVFESSNPARSRSSGG